MSHPLPSARDYIFKGCTALSKCKVGSSYILFSFFFSECYLNQIERIDENIEDIDIGDECTIAELLDCNSADI